MNAVSVIVAGSTTEMPPPFLTWFATYIFVPSGEILTSIGCPPTFTSPVIWSVARSMRSTQPENSQLAIIVVPSALKSAWFTPAWGIGMLVMSCQVVGSRTSILLSRSAITNACLPSGEK